MSKQKKLKKKWQDSDNIWLPYTQMQNAPASLAVKKTKNCYIYLENNKKLLDGICSWWSACHGYNHPHLIKQAKKQLKIMPHIMLAGLANKPAYRLATRLANFVNQERTMEKDKLSKVFLSDSGSTAVEVALKISVQYFLNQKNDKKCKIISFTNSYHGDTMGGMSLCDPSSGMHKKFKNFLPKQLVTKLPQNNQDLENYQRFLEKNHHKAAAIIIEPLVQCAGGMKFYKKENLEKMIKITKKYDILVIFDECATGFYRLGKKFAFFYLKKEFSPDILILGKALTGGIMTLAATITKKHIFDNFLSDSLNNALMHGPTFMGNALACSVANASLDLFEKKDFDKKIEKIEKILKKELAQKFKNHNAIKEIRVIGAVAVLELKAISWDDIQNLRKELLKQEVWLRPFSNVIYFMPSFTITEKQIKKLVLAVSNVL